MLERVRTTGSGADSLHIKELCCLFIVCVATSLYRHRYRQRKKKKQRWRNNDHTTSCHFSTNGKNKAFTFIWSQTMFFPNGWFSFLRFFFLFFFFFGLRTRNSTCNPSEFYMYVTVRLALWQLLCFSCRSPFCRTSISVFILCIF